MANLLGECLRAAKQQLHSVSESANIDAEVLMASVIKKGRTFLFAHPEFELNDGMLHAFHAFLDQRLSGVPIAYIVGEKEFWSLTLKVNKSTLIPRPDTEVLVEKVLEFLPKSKVDILDLGTGTGAIALAIASERSDCSITAVDCVSEAVELAKENAQRLAIHNVSIHKSDWFSNVKGKFDCIVSNPPYIDEADEHLNNGDVCFEPRSALVASNNGLEDIERIAKNAKAFLRPGGGLFVEHGWRQGFAVRKVFSDFGYLNISTYKDYGGNERITFGSV